MTTRCRLYVGFQNNTNETISERDVWERIPYPSGGIMTFRNEGGPNNQFVVSGTECKFTWTGNPSWFKTDCICNVMVGSGYNDDRSLEYVWFKNGGQYGIVRTSHMNNRCNEILVGLGFLYLETGDYIEPMVRNIENSNKIVISNATFSFWQDSDL